jgi:hypothetical protein
MELPVQLGGEVGLVEILGVAEIVTPTLSVSPPLGPSWTDTTLGISSDVTMKHKQKGKLLHKWVRKYLANLRWPLSTSHMRSKLI